MTYAELSEAQARRSRQFAEAQTDAMSVYCDAERDLKDLQAENDRLRELVKAAYRCIRANVSCEECRLVCSGCTLQTAMRELGVEV